MAPECWAEDEFNRNEPNYRAKNVKLREMLNRVERALMDVEVEGVQVSIPTLKRMVDNAIKSKISEVTFNDVIDEYITTLRSEGTKTNYRMIKAIVAKYAGDGVRVGDIDKEWMRGLELYYRRKGRKINTIWAYASRVRAVVNYALDKEYLQVDHLRGYKLKKEATRKRALSVDELREIIRCDVTPRQEIWRDVFVLMFYLVGINSVDLLTLPPLKGDRINYRRAKTGKMYDIKIEPEAMAIINKYRGKVNMLSVLDRIKAGSFGIVITRYLRMLKRKETGEVICPDMSPYWARHTWATIAAELDIPMETISAALGHSTGGVTSVYIKFNHKKVDEANRRVIDYVLYNKR